MIEWDKCLDSSEETGVSVENTLTGGPASPVAGVGGDANVSAGTTDRVDGFGILDVWASECHAGGRARPPEPANRGRFAVGASRFVAEWAGTIAETGMCATLAELGPGVVAEPLWRDTAVVTRTSGVVAPDCGPTRSRSACPDVPEPYTRHVVRRGISRAFAGLCGATRALAFAVLCCQLGCVLGGLPATSMAFSFRARAFARDWGQIMESGNGCRRLPQRPPAAPKMTSGDLPNRMTPAHR